MSLRKPPSGRGLASPFGAAAALAPPSSCADAGAHQPTSTLASLGPSLSTPLPSPSYPPHTPDSVIVAARPNRSGSATPSDEAISVSSGATSAFSAADATLFAPASTEDAVHAVPSLLSLLLSGRTDEQVLAARKLHAYCLHSGRPVEAAIAAAGGVHMLLIMLDSLDRSLRDLCTRILTDLAADDRVRAEILSSPGGTAKVIQLMYRGILDGQASAGRFLELLAGSRDEAVQAALCHGKVVRMLCKTLGAAPTPKAKGAALAALQAFCKQDAANLRKLAWSGGCEALLGVLQTGDVTQAQQAVALQLLVAAVKLQPDAASGMASPEAVAALAQYVGSPEVPLALQADAADLLSALAAVPVKREGVQQALTDLVLPRVFEIVHEAAGASAGGPPEEEGDAEAAAQRAQRRRLQASAAAVVAQLVQQDSECCHSILFHAQLLAPAVKMLVSGGRCGAAQQLLAAARAYATSLGPPLKSAVAQAPAAVPA